MARLGRSTPIRAISTARPVAAAAPPAGTVYQVTGTVAATSAVAGTVNLVVAVTGTVGAVSGVSGNVTRAPRIYSVTGIVAAVSSVSGSVTVVGAQPRQLASVAVAPRYAVRAIGTRYDARTITDARYVIRTMPPRHSAADKPRYAVRSL